MIRVALCDDDREALSRMEREVRAFRDALYPDGAFELRSYTGGRELLADMEQGARFHILLLDVMMPQRDGIETAREVRLLDREAKIVFLTDSPLFALDSYEVRAFSYLLKSAPRERLFEVLREAVQETEEAPDGSLLLSARGGLLRLRYSQVEYLEILGRTLIFHMADGETCQTRGTLTQLEQDFLARENFIKPHRAYIVNMDYVRRLAPGELRLAGGSRVPVSRGQHNEVKRRYIAYSFGKGADNGRG